MVQSGDTAVSDVVAQEILKVKVNLPTENKSIDNVRRMDVVCAVILPPLHPFRVYVSEHLKHMEAFSSLWEDHETSDPRFQQAKGLFHCQYFSLRADNYWRLQGMVDYAVTLPPPSEIFDKIGLRERWEPLLSVTLRSALKIDAFCRAGVGSLESGHGGGGTVTVPGGSVAPDGGSTDISSLSGGPSLAGFLAQLQAAGLPVHTPGDRGTSSGGGGAPGSGGAESNNTKLDNPQFCVEIFGEFKNRKVDGKTVRSKDVRRLISSGSLPPLPRSKLNSSLPVCLAWHTKGQCNLSCPSSADHVLYTTAEYQPLKQWCVANYPGTSS